MSVNRCMIIIALYFTVSYILGASLLSLNYVTHSTRVRGFPTAVSLWLQAAIFQIDYCLVLKSTLQ